MGPAHTPASLSTQESGPRTESQQGEGLGSLAALGEKRGGQAQRSKEESESILRQGDGEQPE